MAISMYQASVPVFISSMKNLSSILRKAVAHADKQGFDPNVLAASRLYPDMFPLTRQVQIASDNAKGAGARLAGMDPPTYEDTETTFPELFKRIDKTIAFLRTLKAAQFDGSEDRRIVLEYPGEKLEFNGQDYLLTHALPNFFFHVTTAYGILRHNGVAIGKQDYLGEPPSRTGKSSPKKKAA